MTDQAQTIARSESLHAARELGMWLRALVSFFRPGSYPPAGAAQAQTLSRDFSCETRVVEGVLFRCLQLIGGDALADPLAGDVAAEILLGEPASASGSAQSQAEGGPALLNLEEALKDASRLCGAVLEAGAVSFEAWAGLGGMLARALEHSEAAAELMAESSKAGADGAHVPLSALADRVTPDELGEDMLAILSTLSLALEHLRFVEASLHDDAHLKRLLPVFTLIQEDAGRVLDLIENRALQVEGVGREVRDTLDGTAYAIRMELRKAFEHELAGVCEVRQPPLVFAKIENANGLLRDCFQQSLVALAQCFDAEVDGRRLFPQFHTKLEQSLALRGELWRLISYVRRAEDDVEAHTLPAVLERLDAFEQRSLRLLMYKDREPFERFVEETEAARGPGELAGVLHRLVAFLETLFGQVNMRAVLVSHPFEPGEAED